MIQLFLQLLLAHIIGDFVFQPDRWVKSKQLKKHRSPYFYWHILVHAMALLTILRFNIEYWFGIILIVTSHTVFDLIKLNLKEKANAQTLFFGDQVAHLAVIAGVVNLYEPYSIDTELIYSPKFLLLITALISVTTVSSRIIKIVLDEWNLSEVENDASLNDAGKYIGMLERLFVFGFVVMNQWQALGFLLAAKSVFRFGDLSKSKDRKLTEYILIGTLLSFGLAIVLAMTYNYFSNFEIK